MFNGRDAVSELALLQDVVASNATEADGATAVVRTFSTRFNLLLENIGFPGVNAGRYTVLGQKYGVARQQAHRWCNAQALPAPHLLVRIAADFETTLDWLLGAETVSTDGVEIPVYKLKSPDIEAVQSNFALLGRMRFLASSPTSGRSYAILQNWAEGLDPPFSRGEELLIDLSSQSLDDGAYYLIRTATSTSVRKANIQPDGASVRFVRTTPLNAYSSTYAVEDIYHNETQRFDAGWTQPGVLVLGRIEATMRSLLPKVPSFISA